MSFTNNFLTKLDAYNAAHGAFNPNSAPIQEFLNKSFPNSNSQPYPGLNDKLAAFDAINTATFYPELAKIKYLLLDSNRANTFIYTYKSAGEGYFASILSNLQKLFPNMFIYYNKSAYQSLIYSSIRFIPGDAYSDAINSTNTIFISQSALTTHLTGQLIFTYSGTNNNQIPFIVATGITISYSTASNSNIVTVTVNITYDPSNIVESSNFGLSFANVIGFYQNNATNINIETLTNIPLSKAGNQFSGLTTLSIVKGQNPIISSGTSLSNCFNGCTEFNSDISGWNTTNVTQMDFMFTNSVFNQPIGGWNTSRVTDMKYMFAGSNFNQPIGGWNTSSVTYMTAMFFNCPFNQPIGGWDTSSVTDMSYMFCNNVDFNQPIGGWNTSSVTVITQMFYRRNDSRYERATTQFNNGNTPMLWTFLIMPTNYVNWHTNCDLSLANAPGQLVNLNNGDRISFK
jgi:surface protein